MLQLIILSLLLVSCGSSFKSVTKPKAHVGTAPVEPTPTPSPTPTLAPCAPVLDDPGQSDNPTQSEAE